MKKTFIEMMEGYFGEYNAYQKELVEMKIAQIKGFKPVAVFDYLIAHFSPNCKIPPGVKEILEAVSELEASSKTFLPTSGMEVAAQAVKSRQDALREEIEWEEKPRFKVNGELKSYKELYLAVLFDLVDDQTKAEYEVILDAAKSKGR